MIRVQTYLLDNMSQTLTGTLKEEWETWTVEDAYRKEQRQPQENSSSSQQGLDSRMGFKEILQSLDKLLVPAFGS